MDQTKKKIIEMLKENTGRHMLDSGGAYGRHWERNQERIFDREPPVFLTFDKYGIEVTHNLYHWLSERLVYDEEMDDKFNKFSEKPENKDKSWLENVEDFIEFLGVADEADTINSYNGEDMLSQIILYTTFPFGDGCYVLLSVHGGCDARSGYSKPVVFQEYDYGSLYDNARCTIQCIRSDVDPNQLELEGFEIQRDPHYWDTYNAGYEWEADGSYRNLEEYEISMNEEDKGKDKIYVDGDGNGYCPVCGSRLIAS